MIQLLCVLRWSHYQYQGSSLHDTADIDEEDSEDDFNSVTGEEEIELHDLLNLKDPFWSDQVVNVDGHDQVLTVNKEIKLDSIFTG
ncbi:hypothetical protein WN944_013413 [Citrus x changshan-huyou]|uniref:Uncharacterized protein n=1 Tax=Citrus x changshan-huyou TaxID=2935761 RepID=A0AAP0QKH6_9ROSI